MLSGKSGKKTASRTTRKSKPSPVLGCASVAIFYRGQEGTFGGLDHGNNRKDREWRIVLEAEMNSTIFRMHRREEFCIIARAAVQDARLSFRATGLLAYLLSLPTDWKVSVEHLRSARAEGRDAIRSALNELRKFGYAHLAMVIENGRAAGKVWNIYEDPRENPRKPEEPSSGTERLEIRLSEKPEIGKPATTKYIEEVQSKEREKEVPPCTPQGGGCDGDEPILADDIDARDSSFSRQGLATVPKPPSGTMTPEPGSDAIRANVAQKRGVPDKDHDGRKSSRFPTVDNEPLDEYLERRWNSIPGIVHYVRLTPKRLSSLKARAKEEWWLENFRTVLDAISEAPPGHWTKGGGEREWRANIDWFLRPDTVLKHVERMNTL